MATRMILIVVKSMYMYWFNLNRPFHVSRQASLYHEDLAFGKGFLEAWETTVAG